MPVCLQEEQRRWFASWLKVLPQITSIGKDVETLSPHMVGVVAKLVQLHGKQFGSSKKPNKQTKTRMII